MRVQPIMRAAIRDRQALMDVRLINRGQIMPRYLVMWTGRSIMDNAEFSIVEQRHDKFYDSYWWCMKHKSASCKCIEQVKSYRLNALLDKPDTDNVKD